MAKRVPYVQAMELAECGAASLTMVLKFHGRDVPLSEVREVAGTGRDGVDAGRLVDAARWYGMSARGVQADLEELPLLPQASILHWNLEHFVVLDRVGRDHVDIVDPAAGRRRVPMTQFSRSYTGVAVVCEPTESFEPARRSARGTWRYLRPMLRQSRLLRRILVTSALLRLFALAVPILMLAVVSRVVPDHDRHLLAVVTAAMVAMAAYYWFSSFVRAHLLLRLRTHLDLALALGFVDHLVDLPYAFFLKRSAGDLMMRLRSNAFVRELLTTGAIAALLDGTLVALYLVALMVLSWQIGLLVLALGAAQVVVLIAARSRTQRLTTESLEVEARSESYVFQMLAGIETLKAAGAEHRAASHWANLFVAEVNVSLARGRLTAIVDSAVASLRLLSPLLVLAVGAQRVLNGDLSLATMLALGALAAGFLEPLATLVTTGLQLLLVRSYMERINDVLDTPVEQAGRDVRVAPRLSGDIRGEHLCFRYAPPAPLVLDDVSLAIEPGQKIAIVGRSGSGKSTLAHLLLGLYPPESGRVLYDGVDLADLQARSVRAQLGIVTQGAYLFSGSIHENIALSNPHLSTDAITRAAQLACIHDDIAAMPMGYDTILVDGGASLSGGQRQRIALARALAHEPRILLLDEATSALDALTEADVYANLEALDCTAVIIAHRLSTIARADLIVVLDDGRAIESGSHADLVRGRGLYADLVAAQTATDEAST
jgi:ABC-type bacteriocin/lantibiotic exporter with double-glycine peptidase domain